MASAGFPLWHAIRTGYTETFRNFGKVLKLAWKPFVVLLVAHYAVPFAYAVPEGIARVIAIHVPLFIKSACFGLFALAICRYQVLGWSDATNHISWKLGRREAAVLAITLALFLFREIDHNLYLWLKEDLLKDHRISRLVISIPLSFVPTVVLCRLAFALPAIAEDVPNPFVKGWDLGKGELLRMILLMVSTTYLLGLAELFLRRYGASQLTYVFMEHGLSYQLLGLIFSVVLPILFYPLSLLGYALAAMALSEAYKCRVRPGVTQIT